MVNSAGSIRGTYCVQLHCQQRATIKVGKLGSLCKHGNVNVLTIDKGTSRLAQGPIAHSCLVEVERFDGELPALTAFDPPLIFDMSS